jgi:hypothetical protein
MEVDARDKATKLCKRNEREQIDRIILVAYYMQYYIKWLLNLLLLNVLKNEKKC